ncbi:hypothetical protein [Winogradskyella aurantia]|uniref:DinB-like domain-containing protein n=1 Tax=Winogradskyella aurantia TaxID=1915063 RepID=A0A265UXG0_9FLAO|nr:hypothetical protein [Winogradskyella aurantia]OZV70008.1 hypothetical protein CA834_05160 [Winogradskyella aurantia]
MFRFSAILTIMIIPMLMNAQSDKLPYHQIPEYSETYTAGTVTARMIDGLGFRFYWATNGLTEKDLEYRPNSEGRSTEETIQHIYSLSKVIINSTLNAPNSRTSETLDYQQLREKTLINLKTAADTLRGSEDISNYKIIFGEQEFPFWNQINGPISDAIWHCGQIAINRRSSGNPISSRVNHFSGTVKE